VEVVPLEIETQVVPASMVFNIVPLAGKATVMKFDGANWVNVGSACFSAGTTYSESLKFSPSGVPYVAYTDSINSSKATVMRFDGTNWVNVGNADFSAGEADWTSLAFSPTGQPYIAYMDAANSYKATVMRYDSVFVGINERQKSKFFLSPNPATNQITIETSEIPHCNLSITNLNGQQLITSQITKPKTQIDISNLSIGVYFIRLTNDKTVEEGKFIKQ
jgi:Secretion system C-terminal sorting domain